MTQTQTYLSLFKSHVKADSTGLTGFAKASIVKLASPLSPASILWYDQQSTRNCRNDTCITKEFAYHSVNWNHGWSWEFIPHKRIQVSFALPTQKFQFLSRLCPMRAIIYTSRT
ncbi:K7_02411p [Saccharomyces cerevisiae Kyokai no. 7]|uniref:K7_02411p n=1 Tax=Saccharomyces cerevisiae (strain Kyokai no. 7 / NBRC 101557) TaxID=721032 RepID=G2WDN5_YEASK|nr:K7_02411p [Saccharomyces cerevisiae Kyokai no. 7]